MKTRILKRIAALFDVPVMQNNLRGLWVEAMITELLGCGWKFTGGDWSGWDLENENGTRIEIKQSAKEQTWGTSRNEARFDIRASQGYYPDGINYVENIARKRLADFYVFAWHEGTDHRIVDQWQFFIVASNLLPEGQKTIGLNGIRKLTDSVSAVGLRHYFRDDHIIQNP